MNKLLNLPENEQDNVLPFLKPAGNGTDDNWLAMLCSGTCFLSREKKDQSAELVEHHVVFQGKNITVLAVVNAEGRTFRRAVDTLRFSRKNDRVETLSINPPEQQENTEEKENP